MASNQPAASLLDPPFATATLARLYLAQGHIEAAGRIAAELRTRGEDGAEALDQALAKGLDGRAGVLHELLEWVQEHRRHPRPEGHRR